MTLDDILDNFDSEINVGVAYPEAKQQIKALMLEIVGEDAEIDVPYSEIEIGTLSYDLAYDQFIENKLRAELCRKIEGL